MIIHYFGLNHKQVGTKDHQRFQASYATILKARMTSLKKREKKDKRKAVDAIEKKPSKSAKPMDVDKKPPASVKRSTANP